MPIEEIKRLPVAALAAPDAVLVLWVNAPMLLDALAVVEAWGFSFKTIGPVWGKTTKSGAPAIGQGYWYRAGAEVSLFATKGKPQRRSRGVRQLILEPRREHSRKPDRTAGDLERLVDGPYIERFARAQRSGWTCWGDEVEKFSGAA
jgi:N6-adenosine-specific RNA methylase IME4